MNTREEIISLLSKSKKPLRAKEIASELKKTNSNIRKILSNLHKEGKITRAEINKYRRTYFQRLKIKDPEAYGKMRKAKNRYLKDWRARNPDYNKKWLRAYYRKYPERVREYQRRYWLKKALSQAGS